jgi:hypothetical protein
MVRRLAVAFVTARGLLLIEEHLRDPPLLERVRARAGGNQMPRRCRMTWTRCPGAAAFHRLT